MQKVIDVHVHPRIGSPSLMEEIQAEAALYGIVKVALLGNVGYFGYHPTEEQVGKHPDFAFGLCHLNPLHGEAFILREMERCIEKGILRGVKLEAAVVSRDRRLDPLMRKAIELDVPVLHHAWYKTVDEDPDESGRDFAPQLGRIVAADISAEDREMILYRNAWNLFRLEA